MPKENKLTLKRQRCEQVNKVILIIASHGRRFFYDDVTGRYASMEVDHRGKVWIVDEYTGKRIFTHETVWGGRWHGFNHGGTLKVWSKSFGTTSARENHCTRDTSARSDSATAISGVTTRPE
ncbi:hypothetical protein [Pseudomonas gozinkensis]|uniref:hypothetical protein n=1 Tax=Pseudomonas gozinkensis TaxID=2774461 RepID=UPI001FC87BAA|nr:hypothetical protein [Pseudomonas gozinkensis]